MRRPSCGVLVMVTALGSACASETPRDGEAFSIRDSAGVRIVESRSPAWGTDPALRVDSVPLFVIGERELDLAGSVQATAPESSAYSFDAVRAAELRDDGGVLVLEGGTSELRRFDSSGVHRWSVGGAGGGPGEFRSPSYLGTYADGSIALWDRSVARLTVIGPDGALRRTQGYESVVGRQPAAYGVFPDSSLMAVFPTSISAPAPGTLFTDTIGFWRVTQTDAEPVLLARHPGPIGLWTGRFQLNTPFTSNPLRALRGAQLIVSSGAAPSVFVYDTTGRLVERYDVQRAPVPIDPDDVNHMIDFTIEQKWYGDVSREVWDEWLPRMPVPDMQPAYDQLVVASDGALWLRLYVPLHVRDAASEWDVFAADGVWQGTVQTPRGLLVTSVRNGRIAGITRDSLDVPSIRVHAIVR